MEPSKQSSEMAGFTGLTTMRPKYEAPVISVMNEAEVLIAFQMSAAKIGAAGCWRTGCNNSAAEENS